MSHHNQRSYNIGQLRRRLSMNLLSHFLDKLHVSGYLHRYSDLRRPRCNLCLKHNSIPPHMTLQIYHDMDSCTFYLYHCNYMSGFPMLSLLLMYNLTLAYSTRPHLLHFRHLRIYHRLGIVHVLPDLHRLGNCHLDNNVLLHIPRMNRLYLDSNIPLRNLCCLGPIQHWLMCLLL